MIECLHTKNIKTKLLQTWKYKAKLLSLETKWLLSQKFKTQSDGLSHLSSTSETRFRLWSTVFLVPTKYFGVNLIT